MAKPVAVPPAKKSIMKREPVIAGSAAITLLSTALYVLPAFGIKIPPNVAKYVSLALQLGGSFGIRNLVKPA
jgi:hypothetical protein